MHTELQHQESALDDIFISATNPRKHVDQEKLKELAKDVAIRGVLQAVLCRKAAPDAPAPLELIFGSRRYRAAKLAKLESIPVRVVEMSDQDVLDAQAAENSQRQDVHPLEEAELYELMLKPPAGASWPARTVDEIAAKLTKSRSAIYARLKLLELTPENRKRFYADKLDASTALLLARIPDQKLQDRAGKELTDEHGGERMSFREAQRHVRERYMLRLSEAPFPVADALLFPAAGACTTCPKKTGNQKELFADVDSADLCTDPTCFKAKSEAAWKVRVAAETAKGREVLSQKASDEVFKYGNETPTRESGYLLATDICPDDPKKRSYKELIESHAVVVAQSPRGKAVELIERSTLKAMLREAGHKWAQPKKADKPKPGKGSTDNTADDELVRTRAQARATAEFMAKFPQNASSVDFWRAVAMTIAGNHQLVHYCSPALIRRTLGADKVDGSQQQLKKEPKVVVAGIVKKATRVEEIQALVVELLLDEVFDSFGLDAPAMMAMLKVAGVDYKAHEKAVRSELAIAAEQAKVDEAFGKKAPTKKGARK